MDEEWDELFNVATDGESNLKDDERLQSVLTSCLRSMTEIHGFTKHFNAEVKFLILSRESRTIRGRKH